VLARATGGLGTGRRPAGADQHAGRGGSQTFTLSIQTLLTLTALTFIPARC
jgi:hypothetical protein